MRDFLVITKIDENKNAASDNGDIRDNRSHHVRRPPLLGISCSLRIPDRDIYYNDDTIYEEKWDCFST